MNYYIQGDPARAEQIKDAFAKMGFVCTIPNSVFRIKNLFFLTRGGVVESHFINKTFFDIVKTNPGYKELELPKPHYDIKNFKPGMPVLVRDNKDQEWRHTTFSHISSRFDIGKFEAGCTCWIQCIPYEGNEHLLGTTDMPSEEYINW